MNEAAMTRHGNEAWIAMFRRIPGNLHDLLALGLTTGAEVMVQKIIKLEPDFMIVRGRLAGTQDAGRILLVPYTELAYMAIQRLLKDTEVEAIFGAGPPPVGDMQLAPVEDGPLQETPAAPAAPVAEPAPVPVSPAKKSDAVSKAALVAKLRDRLKEGGK